MEKLLFKTHSNRFSPKRKKRFREDLKLELEKLGYHVVIDKRLFSSNIYFGNPKAKYALTAHYDTATNMAVVYPFMKYFGARYGQLLILVPALLTIVFFPEYYLPIFGLFALVLFIGLLIPNKYNYNDNSSGVYTVLKHAKNNQGNKDFFYALTDNEEKGLFGAKALRSYLKEVKRLNKIRIINIDCVGTGDIFAITSSSNNNFLNSAHNKCSTYRDLLKIGSKLLSSDHLLFGKRGIMITKVNKSKFLGDVYIPNLHTNKDNVIDYRNIDETLLYIKKITEEAK